MDIDLFNLFSLKHGLSITQPLNLSGKELAGATPANKDDPKYFGYIYEVICSESMKNYVGKHKCLKAKKPCGVDNYFGSGGPYYQNAIEKYGRANFHKFYLDVVLFDPQRTEEEMNKELCKKEIDWIARRNGCNKEIGYNLKAGGDGGWSIVCQTNKGRIYLHKGDIQKQVHPWELETYFSLGFERGMTNKAKAKMSENSSIKGTHRSDSIRALISKNSKGKNLGKKRTDELRARQSAMRLGKVWVNDGNSEKWLSPEDVTSYLSNGWLEGRLSASLDARRKMTEARKGRVWVHLGSDQRFVQKDEADRLMRELSYVAGRGSRTKRVD